MKYYLIKVPFEMESAKKPKCDCTELTPDDYGLILDALYEQKMVQEGMYHNHPKEKEAMKYCEALRKVAKKFERIFGGNDEIR